ncbi:MULTISPECIES: class I SAM-dependent methyltransferase [Gammaproteobacteria]|uniref:class I SAM-dependent methyltransferase n=1 Tax=Gammaproteobacteria TaxID=1236 RepID=UPI000DCFDD04|nr:MULTISPECIES: class I SAM-dependent methyltransferase [Gammaproteobacteria]RTE85921.1 16S rRNA methyltransferase [Aliidiomarina sp. B3213]TCZ90080.1 16S rRNA methyltransferase [Lysobacter sp. N42]
MSAFALVSEVPELSAAAAHLAEQYGFNSELNETQSFYLRLTLEGLELVWAAQQKVKPLQISFTHGKQAWRQQLGGGKQEAVVRALGINRGHRPYILDATAGLGRDGMMLAHSGCKVDLLERHPVVHALLDQAVLHAKLHEKMGDWVSQRVRVLPAGSLLDSMPELLANGYEESPPDAIYLDPMFPERGKTAAVKKDMQMLQQLVGGDEDADQLLPAALALATYRVVVKRPATAPFLAGQTPTTQITTKKHRFDVYIKSAY